MAALERNPTATLERNEGEVIRYKKKALDFFSKAHHYLKIVTGDLHPELYSDEEILKTLQDKARDGVNFQVIVGPAPDQESLNKITEALGDKAKFWELKARPYHDFAIVDGIHGLVENYCLPGTNLDGRYQSVRYNTIFLAKSLELTFERTMKRAHPLHQA